jgi:drug/metabolite transporter (DMT)-like permease
MRNDGRTIAGVAYGIGAGALWGLVFLAPELVPEFGPLQLTIGRYFFYGLFSACLIAPIWRKLKPLLGRREWIALGWLALTGNVLYYILLSNAVRLGGIAMTSLVIGFLPVAVTIVGSREQGAVPLRRLMLSLALSAVGAVCIGWQALVGPAAESVLDQVVGLLCAVGALISWTCYAVGNSRWLVRLDHVSPHEWNMLNGVVTGAQALLLIPLAFLVATESHTTLAWAKLAGVAAGVAILCSMVGNALWNRMSKLLPLTLVGQMILFETLFALIYGFLWGQRLPTALEYVAFTLVVLSVVSCLAVHAQPRRNISPITVPPPSDAQSHVGS